MTTTSSTSLTYPSDWRINDKRKSFCYAIHKNGWEVVAPSKAELLSEINKLERSILSISLETKVSLVKVKVYRMIAGEYEPVFMGHFCRVSHKFSPALLKNFDSLTSQETQDLNEELALRKRSDLMYGKQVELVG